MRRTLSLLLITGIGSACGADPHPGPVDGGAPTGDRGASGRAARIAALERDIASSPAAGLSVGFTTSFEKVFPDSPWGFSGHLGRVGQLALARNEYESIQLVLFPGRDVRGVRVEVGKLVGAGEGRIGPDVRVRAVGAVNLPTARLAGGRAGWHPDPLLPNQPVDLEAGHPQAFLLTVYAAPETAPGTYTAEIFVLGEGLASSSRDLSVTVWGITLPSTPRFKSGHLGDWRLPDEMWPARLGYPPPSDEERLAHMLRIAELGYANRLPPSGFLANGLDSWDRGPEGSTAYGFPTHDGDGDGRPSFDPRRTDALIDFMLARGANHFFIAITADVDRLPGVAPGRRARLLEYLRDYVAHLRSRGLMDMAYVYNIDEPWGDAVGRAKRTHALIKDSVGADVRIMQNTNQDNSTIIAELLGYFDALDINLGFHDVMAVPAYRRLRPGTLDELWWNINLWPDTHPNLFIEYPLIDARIMGPLSYAHGVEGFEYWDVLFPPGIASYHPIAPDELRVRWDVDRRSLDGTLIYPGAGFELHSSLRLESLRDGFEDLELLYLLEEASPGNELLRVPIVGGLTDYEQDPARVLSFREAVARAISAATP